MSLSEQSRYDIVVYRLEKAQRTMAQAKDNVPMHYWNLIANRLYYAAYYAVSALLLAHGHSTKTHDGTIRLFSQHFVKTGIIPLENGRFYHQLFERRLTGDYGDSFDLTEEDVMPLFTPTEQLITQVSELARQAITNK